MATDAELIRQTLEGDADAYGELVRRYLGMVLGVCRRYESVRHDAHDLAQSTFVRAYLKLGQLRDHDNLSAWLARVAGSVGINSLAGKDTEAVRRDGDGSLSDLPSGETGPEAAAEARELAGAIMKSVAELPYEYREPFELFYLGQLSHKTIAAKIGIAPGNVRIRLHRARAILRARLKPFRPEGFMTWTKELRTLLPFGQTGKESDVMALTYEESKHRLLRGEKSVTIRTMVKDDIPAVRGLDQDLTAGMLEHNLEGPPGYEDTPGGPWSDDKWLAEHFEKYRAAGNISLLAFDDSGHVVGMADLWRTKEPKPFGLSLDIEYIDQRDDYYPLGLSLILMREAEKVAASAGIPSLDVGTNTAEDGYNHLRHFGFRLLYEYDKVMCGCGKKPEGKRPARRMLKPSQLDFEGMLKVDHWSPTEWYFEDESELAYIAELKWPDGRAILELLGPTVDDRCLPVPENKPARCHLYVDAASLKSTPRMSRVLAECAVLAGEAGAEQLEFPCASDVEVDGKLVDVIRRDYMYAWFRKEVS